MPSCAFFSVSGDLQHAAAVVGVDERHVLPRENVARVDDAMRREDDPGIAVGVAAAEVVEVDLIGALADGHLVLEGALRHAGVVVLLEDRHLLHVGPGVFLHHDIDGGWEFDVATHVIAVRMRVDQQRDRLGRQFLDLGEDGLAPSRILRVDDGDAVGHHQHRRVAAATTQDEEVVLDLLDGHNLRLFRLRLRIDDGQAADHHQATQPDRSFHGQSSMLRDPRGNHNPGPRPGRDRWSARTP